MSDPLPIISRFWDNYVGPRLIMWGPRLTMSGPRDYYLGAPTMSGPLLAMSGPWDGHMGTLTYHVGAEIIMFRPRFIMLGPLIIMSGPQLLCNIASIYYIFLITIIFGRCHCSWAAMTPFKCERMQWLKCVMTKLKNQGNNGIKAISLITPFQV